MACCGGHTHRRSVRLTLTFVLVPQPTFGQQAQTKLLGLREISFWEGSCNTSPCSPQSNGFHPADSSRWFFATGPWPGRKIRATSAAVDCTCVSVLSSSFPSPRDVFGHCHRCCHRRRRRRVLFRLLQALLVCLRPLRQPRRRSRDSFQRSPLGGR